MNYTGVIRYVSAVSKTSQATDAYSIRWIPEAVQNLLANHNIANRAELANSVNVSRSVVYTAFDEDWAGEANLRLLAELAGRFRVPLNQLVTEPGRRPVGQQQSGHTGVRKSGVIR